MDKQANLNVLEDAELAELNVLLSQFEDVLGDDMGEIKTSKLP